MKKLPPDLSTLDTKRQAWLIFAVLFCIYCAFSVSNYMLDGSSMDLAIFTQAMKSMHSGLPPYVPIKGSHANIFGDHFHPIFLLCLPFFLALPSPVTLLVIQCACISASIAICHSVLPRTAIQPYLTLAIGVSCGVFSAVIFDFHEVGVGVIFLSLLCRALVMRDSSWKMLILAIPILATKEDAAVAVIGLSVVAWSIGRRWLASGMAAISIFWALCSVLYAIPNLNGSGVYTYFGAAPRSLKSVVTSIAIGSLVLGFTLAMQWVNTTMPSVRSWFVVPICMLFLERVALGNFRYWIPVYHYSLWTSVILFYIFVDRQRLRRDNLSFLRIKAAAIVALTSLLIGPQSISLARAVEGYNSGASELLRRVPTGSSLAVDPKFAAKLVMSYEIVVVDPAAFRSRPVDDLATKSEWILVDSSTASYGGGWVDGYLRLIADRYRTVAVAGSVVLLERKA